MIIINKNESGQVQVYSPDNTETLFPNELTANEVAGEVGNLDTALTAMYTALNTVIGDTYYKKGDKIIATQDIQHPEDGMYVSGIITSSAKNIQMSIPVHKSLKNIDSIKVNSFIGSFRLPTGGYVVGANTDFTASGYTISTYINKELNYINIIITSTNSLGTNNIPINGNITAEFEMQ